MGVGHGLQCGEGFRGDDEQCLRRIEIAHGFREIGAIHIRYEVEGHVALAVIPERLVSHDRTEIGAPDADVDDVANPLASVAFPLPAPHPLAEGRHLVQHGVHRRDHILAVDNNLFSLGRTQGHVQHRPLLGDIDLVSPEHGIDVLAQP